MKEELQQKKCSWNPVLIAERFECITIYNKNKIKTFSIGFIYLFTHLLLLNSV